MTVVIAKCVLCGHKKEIKPGEVPAGEVPLCPKCFLPNGCRECSPQTIPK